MVQMVRAMRAFNAVTSQCGRQKVGLACYAVHLAFWGWCLAVYAVHLAFEGGVSHWKRVPGQYLDGQTGMYAISWTTTTPNCHLIQKQRICHATDDNGWSRRHRGTNKRE